MFCSLYPTVLLSLKSPQMTQLFRMSHTSLISTYRLKLESSSEPLLTHLRTLGSNVLLPKESVSQASCEVLQKPQHSPLFHFLDATVFFIFRRICGVASSKCSNSPWCSWLQHCIVGMHQDTLGRSLVSTSDFTLLILLSVILMCEVLFTLFTLFF